MERVRLNRTRTYPRPDGGGWQPTKRNYNGYYHEGYVDLVYKFRLLGLRKEDIAELLQVALATIDNWRNWHPEFADAWNRGSELADANIAKSLYHRAKGFRAKVQKLFYHKGEVILVDHDEYYPPDTAAAKFWLGNRCPEQWVERREISGPNGQPLYPPPTIIFDFDGDDPTTIDGVAIDPEHP